MPVLLIYSSPSQADEGGSPDGKGTVRLLPCGSSNHMLDAADTLEEVAGVQAVIVSPE